MKDLKGTKTEANLWEAFAGESQAHTKYQYYASVAKKAGFNQVAGFFEETSRNEVEPGMHQVILQNLLFSGD